MMCLSIKLNLKNKIKIFLLFHKKFDSIFISFKDVLSMKTINI